MKRLPLAIWAMVIGAFAMGADEFIVAGVIQEIAADLKVTLGGRLADKYGMAAVVGTVGALALWPGRKVGPNTCSTYASTTWWSVAPDTSIVAPIPLLVSAAMTVVLAGTLRGTFACARLPRGARA